MNNNRKRKLSLGLDIGVTNVGYGVIDLDNGEFVDYGVRLFEEGTAKNNETRRNARGRRRLLRRKQTRLSDMKKLLKEEGFLSDTYKPLDKVYEIRKKGLTEKLTNDEFVSAILHITKYRGTCVEEATDEESEEGKTKVVLAENHKLLTGKYICEVQLERLKECGSIRGNKNNFKTEDYLKEVKQVLSNQEISDELANKIIKIIERRREYYDGPGDETHPTPYGQWWFDEEGKLVQTGMIEKMRGKCSVDPNELRAPKMSISAELFNLLNDLNNLRIDDEKLSDEDKKKIINITAKKGSITLKQIAKELEVDESMFSGFRIDKNGKPLFTELKGYKEIKKIFNNNGEEVTFAEFEMLDNIIIILTNLKGTNERIIELQKYNLKDNLIKELANSTKFTGYHSLSLKIIRLLNEEMIKTDKNQMQLLYELNFYNSKGKQFAGKRYIEADKNAILSPVAKRAINEAVKVVNALRDKYGEFESVVVEMTRCKNSKEEKDKINERQKYFENRNKEIDNLLEERGYDSSKINNKTKLKIKLYMEQDGKSAYTFQPLDLRRIIEDVNYTEIDHIIPLSISLDDSQNNKVLITNEENRDKNNLTPIMAFKSGKFTGVSQQEFIQRSLNNSKYSYKKKQNLKFDKDITKYDVIKEFIHRNLIDTSYACRTVLNTLQKYYKDNNIETKVFTLNGKITDRFRNQIQLYKDRDANHLHHAIDALIVVSVQRLKLLDTYLSKYTFDNFYDEFTGEIKEIPQDGAYLDKGYIMYINNLKTIYKESMEYYSYSKTREQLLMSPIKISWKIDTKPNRQISDETIYSTRNKDGKELLVETVKNIYGTNKESNLALLINGILNNKSTLLMKDNDPKTYEYLQRIVIDHFETYKNYKDSKNNSYYVFEKGEWKWKDNNPFSRYRDEHGPIRKYSKKGNGPEIKSVKLYKEALGNHIDISQKYDTNNKRIIQKQISPYRTDFFLSNGKYKFVTVRYKDVRYIHAKNKYVIDADWYNKQKETKGIADSDSFVCSLHHNELLKIKKDNGSKFVFDESIFHKEFEPMKYNNNNYEILKFTATNNDSTGTIEVKPIYKNCSKQLMPCPSTFTYLAKYATDVLGNIYEIKDNVLKLEF